MRIQCGLCEKNLASVMCCVDEAALCEDCDARTHSTATKKHVRVNLLTAPEPPKCDICQEKRGFFFCLEDRALLCRDCDVSIHTANALSCNHKRFLVTGTRVALEERKEEVLSPAASSQSSHCSTISSPTSTLQRPGRSSTTHVTPDLPKAYSGYTPSCCPPPTTTTSFPESNIISGSPAASEMKKSSFSDFLTDAVPGWRVDELLNFVDCNESFNNSEITAPVKGNNDGVTGDFDWTADLSLFEEQMFALHEVPQFPVAVPQMAPPSSRSRHVRNNRSKQDMYNLPHSIYGDAFIVPEIRMPSGPPTSPPFPKRYKRDLHH